MGGAKLQSLLLDEGRWLAVGGDGPSREGSIILLTGDDDGLTEARRIREGKGLYGRDIAALSAGRYLSAGSRAIPGSLAVLGHPNYQGHALVLGPEGRVEAEVAFGEPGVAGVDKIASTPEERILAASDGDQVWLTTRTATFGAVQETYFDDLRLVHDLAARTRADGEWEVGFLANRADITARDQAVFRVMQPVGRILWSWSATSVYAPGLAIAVGYGRRGWLLAGGHEGQATVVAFDPKGELRWHWTYASPHPGSSRVAALATRPDATILAVMVHPLAPSARGENPVLQRLGPDGWPLGAPRPLLPMSERRVHIADAQAWKDGWLVAGGCMTEPSGYVPCLWRLKADLSVEWAVRSEGPI